MPVDERPTQGKGRIAEHLSLLSTILLGRVTGRLGPAPTFVMIGPDKAGTHSMFDALAASPDVTPASMRQSNYLSRSWLPLLDNYRTLFFHDKDQEETPAVGEACPDYAATPGAARALAGMIPQAKVIAMVEPPVRRVLSVYQAHVENWGLEEPLEVVLETEMALLQPVLERPWDEIRAVLREAGRQRGIVASALYAPQLGPWLDAFPRQQVLILNSADFDRPAESVFQSVCDFVGVSSPAGAAPERGVVPSVSAELQEHLHRFFAAPSRAFREIAGIDFGD